MYPGDKRQGVRGRERFNNAMATIKTELLNISQVASINEMPFVTIFQIADEICHNETITERLLIMPGTGFVFSFLASSNSYCDFNYIIHA